MHIGKPIKRIVIRPRKIRRQKPLALPAPQPIPWTPVRKEEPATVPAKARS